MARVGAIVLLVWIACVLLSVALDAQEKRTGSPVFAVGKQYHVAYACQSQFCYEEAWLVLAVGKDGWLRVVVSAAGSEAISEWWVNVNRVQAVRELAPVQAIPPVEHHPAPRSPSVDVT